MFYIFVNNKDLIHELNKNMVYEKDIKTELAYIEIWKIFYIVNSYVYNHK